jgi:hypothetical protein
MADPVSPRDLVTDFPTIPQARHQLETSEFIAYLEQSPVSNARRYFEFAKYAVWHHDKKESIAQAVVTILAAMAGGVAAAAQGGHWFLALMAGIGGAVVGFVASLFVLFFVHWIRSPNAFHKAAIAERNAALAKLREIQIAGARLAGKIYCMTLDVHQHESELEGLYGDCWFMMSVNVWNDGTTATNITGFRFFLKWASSGDDWPARQVEGLNKFRAKSFRPSDPGSGERYTDEIENLFDFPVPAEITTTNSQRGWLRFVVRNFPLKKDMNLDRDAEITLVGLDKKGEPHTIYQDSMASIGLCPPIEALPTRSESQLQINFHEKQAGYIDRTSVLIRGQLTPCRLYRVSVTYHGTRSTVADLKAEEVTLTDGRGYPPLHLRITGRPNSDKQVRLNPGTPVFWDVVEKANSDRDWVTLRHTERMGEILQRTSATFRITASCDEDLPVTKTVRLEMRDDDNLDFQLLDI